MVVEGVGPPRDGRQVATLRTADEGADGFRLAATLPRYPPVGPGDLVEVGGRVRERPDSPYGQYLDRIGAWGTLDARTLELRGRRSDLASRLESARRAAGDLLTRVLPEPEAGLAAGILIGLRDRVDRGVATAFTTAGVSHVVAISGWNIAIVAAAVAAFGGRFGRRRRSVITAIAIAAYVAFAGASPSVLRAGAMAGVVLLARESGRAGRAAAALGWAAALLLLVDPRLIADAGFQLSTLATAGLIAWASPMTDRLDRWTGGRLPRWLGESLGVSLAAQAATLPVVLATFGRLAVVAPAVNLVVVPLVAPAMAAGLVALAGGALVAAGGPSAIGIALAAPGLGGAAVDHRDRRRRGGAADGEHRVRRAGRARPGGRIDGARRDGDRLAKAPTTDRLATGVGPPTGRQSEPRRRCRCASRPVRSSSPSRSSVASRPAGRPGSPG